MCGLARTLLLHTGHRARINWDNTEVNTRFGYWFAREYGAIYFANRKPSLPPGTVYRPHTVLRDLWELSRYVNLLKFLGTIQNPDHVDRTMSDAHLYDHDYCLAITFFSMPTFFLETKFYDEDIRCRLRPLIRLHHRVREKIRQGITYPIGERPDGASWAGFQNHRAGDRAGLLLTFREAANDDDTAAMALRFAEGTRVVFRDLLTEQTWEAEADRDGQVDFSIASAPGFRIIEYSFPESCRPE